VADSLQDLLDFGHEAVMIDWRSQFDDAEVPWAFCHILFTSITFEVAIDCPKVRVIWTFRSRPKALLIHRFCILAM